jgi:hypothetical protein
MPSSYERDSSRTREKLAQLSEFARSKGGRFLSSEYKDNRSKLVWECQEGHTWESSASSVVTQGTWCPICAGNLPKSLESLREVAEARGGKLLSQKYTNVEGIYEFECSKGHKFSNRYSHVVNRGQWCPTCNKGSKSEELARVAFQHVFGSPFPKKRPKWLRNDRNRQMELDGYAEEIGIAFEYQGIQHFSRSYFGTNVQQRIIDDKKKQDLCNKQNVRLFYLTHEMPLTSFLEEIKKQCIAFGIEISYLNFNPTVDFDKAYIRDDRLEKLVSLLDKKNIDVLSTKWIGTKDLYKFHCRICNNEWEARGTSFFNSRRIAGCDRCARARYGESRVLGIEVLQNFASAHGGECLSTEYIKRNFTYEWKCKVGHLFTGNFNNMKFRNKFCPRCEE